MAGARSHGVLFGLACLLATAQAAASGPEGYEQWTGWIVGKPCAANFQTQDCPLRYVDKPVLLAENGAVVDFAYGAETPIRDVDIDKSYGKKVRITGHIKNGAIQPIRLDALETSGEKKFFKGCL